MMKLATRLVRQRILLAVALVLVTATAGCGGGGKVPPPPEGDTELIQSATAGRMAFDRGEPAQAVIFFERALKRARALDDSAQIGNAAYNLAICRVSLGQHERARQLLHEAAYEAARSGGNLADIVLMEAKTARLQGKPTEAMALADQTLAAPQATAVHKLQAHLLRGQALCDQNQSGAAQAELRQARGYLPPQPSPALSAGEARLAGRIAMLEKQVATALEQFRRELVMLRQAKLYRELPAAWVRLAEASHQAGEPVQAGEYYYQAARMTWAQGERALAEKLVADARAVLAKAPQPPLPLAMRLSALEREMSPATQPSP